MPLDKNAEATVGSFQRFDGSVSMRRDYLKTFTDHRNRLMVKRSSFHDRRADDSREPTFGVDLVSLKFAAGVLV